MGKTRRFGDLVRESGRPEVVTLWTEPKKDRAFSKAIRENRVLTVESDPTSKRKDCSTHTRIRQWISNRTKRTIGRSRMDLDLGRKSRDRELKLH